MTDKELAWNVKRWGIEFFGLQEHRLVHKEGRMQEINTNKTEMGQTLYTASAWRNPSSAATSGVGLVLGTTAQKLLLAVERVSKRIIKASFQGNPALTVIVAYTPTEGDGDENKVNFYRNFRKSLESVAQHNFLAVLGDFNARLGSDDALFTASPETSDNGRRLLEVMEEHQLLAANTLHTLRSC